MCRPVLHLPSGKAEWIGPMEQQFMEVTSLVLFCLALPCLALPSLMGVYTVFVLRASDRLAVHLR